MDPSAEFGRWKAQCLSKADLSRKGSVDEDVAEIVQLLNGQEQFFTTSSCSGRIILLDGSINGFEVQKRNCRWLLVTHKPCIKNDVIVALKNANGDAVLKFEPLVLHIQCQQLQDAQILHSVAIDSGFRNSGITVGKRGKTMLAVRSTHGLEVPLSHKGKLMVTEDYIDFLLKIANQKMEENKKRIERELRSSCKISEKLKTGRKCPEMLISRLRVNSERLYKPGSSFGSSCTSSRVQRRSHSPDVEKRERFYRCLQHALERQTVTKSYPKEKVNEKTDAYSHKKKRNREKARDRCITEENDKERENDDSSGLSAAVSPEDD